MVVIVATVKVSAGRKERLESASAARRLPLVVETPGQRAVKFILR